MSGIHPPTGTVTLLFTDIEGSTKRWEHVPQAMSGALMTHDLILRAAIEEHGGFVFKTIGDAFCAAFADPADALSAAVDAQRSLTAEAWGDVGPVRVRMALHTGEPEHRDRDYFGPPVNRVARLLSTGYGDQVIVSAATADRVKDALPGGTTLLDLGAHRLKDLLQPERIYQLIVPGLSCDFPPIKSLDRQPHNLPAQPTPLVGREEELARVRSLVEGESARLLTLTGPGGIGKTRLALQVAADLVDTFPDGAWFAGMAPITDADLVVPTIAQSLGVREAGHESVEQALLDYLRDKRLLLLLDNFEHVVSAAPALGRLLAECRGVQVLATSRAVLRVYGEREVAVPPLPLPDPKRLPVLTVLAEIPSIELFVERAKAVRSAFELTAENAPVVAGICVRLDGLPLAIELAAARTRVLSPDKLLERLGKRLDLLTGGASDRAARQQTLRGTIAWSHDLLPPGQQVLFRRLSVFAGGASLEAVEAVADADGELGALDGLEALVQQSLLRQDESPDGEPRFMMLETIREFATERVDESAEAAAVRERHAAHFLAFAETAEPHLTGSEQPMWLERLEIEHDNLRAALGWFSTRGEHESETGLAAALWRFWYARGHLTEGRQHLERLLTTSPSENSVSEKRLAVLDAAGVLAETQGDLHRASELYDTEHTLAQEMNNQHATARALLNLGTVAMVRSNYSDASANYEQARSLFEELGHERGVAIALERLYHIARFQEDLDRAETLATECLAVYRKLGDAHAICFGMQNLAILAFLRRDYAAAAKLNQQVIDSSKSLGDRQTEAYALVTLARSLRHLGDNARSVTLCEEALTLFEALGDRAGTAYASNFLGLAKLARGDRDEARRHLAKSLTIRRDLGDREAIAQSLEGAAMVAFAASDAETGAMLFGAAQTLRRSIGAPLQGADRDDYHDELERAHSAFGEAAFEAAWTLGGVMTIEQAIEEAMAGLA